MSEQQHNLEIEQAEAYAKELEQETADTEVTEEAAPAEEQAEEAKPEEQATEETSSAEGEEVLEEVAGGEEAAEASENAAEEPSTQGEAPDAEKSKAGFLKKLQSIEQKWLIIGAGGLVLLVLLITFVALLPSALRANKEPGDGDITNPAVAQPTASYPLPTSAQANTPEYDQGLAHFNESRYTDAIISFTQAVRKDPGNARIYTFRGASYYLLGQYPEALGDLTRAVQIDANSKYAYDFRARVYDALGQPDLATADRNQSIQLGG